MSQLSAAASAVAAIGDQLVANGLTVTPASAAAGLAENSNPSSSRQSPSPNTIYSGVDLARLASQAATTNGITMEKIAAAASQELKKQGHDLVPSKPVFPTSLIGNCRSRVFYYKFKKF